MDWLLSHEDELKGIPDEEPEGTNDQQVPPGTTSEEKAEPQIVKSIKCEDCGKLFKTTEEVEYHATKSGLLYCQI